METLTIRTGEARVGGPAGTVAYGFVIEHVDGRRTYGTGRAPSLRLADLWAIRASLLRALEAFSSVTSARVVTSSAYSARGCSQRGSRRPGDRPLFDEIDRLARQVGRATFMSMPPGDDVQAIHLAEDAAEAAWRDDIGIPPPGRMRDWLGL